MPSQKRITIADVAKAAGVSTGTVSRVLNQRHGDIKISEETRKLVLEAANRLGYSPNPFASALRTQRTGMIGTIVRDIGDPFLSMMLREIHRVARSMGIDVLFGHAEYDLDTVGRHVAFMHSHLFDGLLLLGDMPGEQDVLRELVESNTPFVAVACGEESPYPSVNVDEAAGVKLAFDYLYSLGHRRIAFIGNLEHGGIKERLIHFQRLLSEHDMFSSDDYVRRCGNSRAAASDCAQDLLSLPNPPTAIFCATDLAALGAMNGALRLGLRVPGDVSIIGFDDIEETPNSFPALTTIRQPIGDMANQAVRLLMRLVKRETSEEEENRVVIQPRLIVRQSCAPRA
jgi:LacI family repressor for deo operon, udp, cdd, tsx, nupC, and nupG